MADDSNGYVRRPEVERMVDRLESRLKVHIAEAKADAEDAAKIAVQARDAFRKITWSIGGGTIVTTFLVALWTTVIQPLLALLPKP